MSIPFLSLAKPASPAAEPAKVAPPVLPTFLSLCMQTPSASTPSLSIREFHQRATASISFLALSKQPTPSLATPASPPSAASIRIETAGPRFQRIPVLHPNGTLTGFFRVQGETSFVQGKSNETIVFRSYCKQHFDMDQTTGGKHLPRLFDKHLKENRAAQLLAIPVLPILNRETALKDRHYVLPRVENLSPEMTSEKELIETLQKIAQSAYDFELPLNAHASQFHFEPTQNQIVFCELPFTMKDSQDEAFSYTVDSILESWCKRFFPTHPEKKQLLDPRILTLSILPQEEELLSRLNPERISQLLARSVQTLQQATQAIPPSSLTPSSEEQKNFALSIQTLQQEMGLSAFSLSTLRNLQNIKETLQQIFNTGISFRDHLRSIQIRMQDGSVHTLLSLVEKKGLLQEKPTLEMIRTAIIPFILDILCEERLALRPFLSPVPNSFSSK